MWQINHWDKLYTSAIQENLKMLLVLLVDAYPLSIIQSRIKWQLLHLHSQGIIVLYSTKAHTNKQRVKEEVKDVTKYISTWIFDIKWFIGNQSRNHKTQLKIAEGNNYVAQHTIIRVGNTSNLKQLGCSVYRKIAWKNLSSRLFMKVA